MAVHLNALSGGFETHNVPDNKIVIVKSIVNGYITDGSGRTTAANITIDGKTASASQYPIKCSQIASSDITVYSSSGYYGWSHGYIEFYEIDSVE